MNMSSKIRLLAVGAALGWQLMSVSPLAARGSYGGEHHSGGQHKTYSGQHGERHSEGEGQEHHGQDARKQQDNANVDVNGSGGGQPVILDPNSSSSTPDQDQADQLFNSYDGQNR